jgi:hypothetical protein
MAEQENTMSNLPDLTVLDSIDSAQIESLDPIVATLEPDSDGMPTTADGSTAARAVRPDGVPALRQDRAQWDRGWADADLRGRGELIDPILREWTANVDILHTYPSGSWGSPAADALLVRDGREWRRPGR